MKEKFVLPINLENIPFKAYQMRGFEFAALNALEKDIYPFTYSFFINCFYLRDETHLHFNFTSDKRSFFIGYNAFLHKNLELDHELVNDEQAFTEAVKRYIATPSFIVGEFDEYYIPGKYAYGKYYWEHAFFLYGYDDEKEAFMAMGYIDSGDFETYEIKYHDFYNAFVSRNSKYLMLRYPNSDFDFEYLPLIGAAELGWYLNSTYHDIRLDPRERYGISACEGFLEYIDEMANTEGMRLDLRFSRFFMEHKAFMSKRLKYLYGAGFISSDVSAEYLGVEQAYHRAHMMFIKYNMTGKKDIAARVIEMLRAALTLEVNILNRVLDELLQRLSEREREIFRQECLIDMNEEFKKLLRG